MTNNNVKASYRAFTLIELLVVIAIIALLAAILFPVFGRARENARRTACVSNMKQIALGMMQYTQDYDEFIIPSRNKSVNNAVTPWQYIVQPYLKSTQLFKCPSNKQEGSVLGTNFNGVSIPTSYYSNGGYDGSDSRGPGGLRPMKDDLSKRLSALESASTTILICERNDSSSSFKNDKLNDSREIFDVDAKKSNFTNHLGMTSFIFADGHAKAMKPIPTITPLNMWIITDQSVTTPKAAWVTAINSAQAEMND